MSWRLEVVKPTGRKLSDGRDVMGWSAVPGAIAPDADGWLVLELVERSAARFGGARASSSFATIMVRRNWPSRVVEVRANV